MNTTFQSNKTKCSIKDILKLTQHNFQPLSLNHQPITRGESDRICRNLYTKSSGDAINNIFMKKSTNKLQLHKGNKITDEG